MLKKIIIIFFVLGVLFNCKQEEASKEILFVCTHGAARSPIAAAYFNKLSKEQNLKYHAVFRGTEPDSLLTKETILGLKNDGFDVEDWKPKKVDLYDIKKAYKTVTFDCNLPTNNDSNQLSDEQWNGTPSISKDYNVAKDTIKEKVEKLIESLPKN